MSSAARGYGHKWRVARAAYLEKHPFCKYCLRDMGISYDQDAHTIGEQCDAAGHDLPFASVVDHIIPHQGNMTLFWDSENNWASMCGPHHSGEKQRQEKADGY